MSDPIDDADLTIQHNLSASIAAAKSYQRPKGLVARGSCWVCEVELDHPQQLFCAAEPGQRESDCVRYYNRHGVPK